MFFGKVSVQRAYIKIAEVFLTEVAVLVAIFPILDTVIEQGQSKVTRSLVWGSIALAVSCLLLAGIAAGIIAKEDREE